MIEARTSSGNYIAIALKPGDMDRTSRSYDFMV